jgi:DNA-directed RNA polymerase specialized sigma24 family protein
MAVPGSARGLTPEAFGRFLRWLSPNDDQAVREYLSIRNKLVRYFIHKGCSDPDKLFDDTVDIVVAKVDTWAECPSPLNYCYGVAKNIWRQDLRERRSVALDQDIVSPEHNAPEIHEHELNCLEHCMEQLASSDRDLVTRYHQFQGRDKIEIRRLLADRFGGVNKLRIRMCRIRKDLRTCVVNCVKRSAH